METILLAATNKINDNDSTYSIIIVKKFSDITLKLISIIIIYITWWHDNHRNILMKNYNYYFILLLFQMKDVQYYTRYRSTR